MSTLIVRADAGAAIGAGHLMRCLALADAWEAAGGTTVVMTDASIADRITAVRGERRRFVPATPGRDDAESAEEIGRVAGSCAGGTTPWVVADGYRFSEAFHRALRHAAVRLMVVDDTVRLPHYAADVVLNQNPGAERSDYAGDDDTQFLLGGRYTMLRPQVIRRRPRASAQPEMARRLLLTMGGADPDNVTARVMEALTKVRVPGLEATVVVGPLNRRADELADAARQSPVPMTMVVNPPDLAALMVAADVAVSASGSTAWELLFLGVPSLLIPVAENQRVVLDAVRGAAAADAIGEPGQLPGQLNVDALAAGIERLCLDANRRAALSQRARQFIDGRGAARVVECMGRGGAVPFARLRRAAESDVRAIWNISNDPDVRRQAFNPAPIPYEQHVQWFSARLASPASAMWVLDADGDVVAQIRYDRADDGTAVMSFSVAAAWRGHGLGGRLLASTWRRACGLFDVDRVRGVAFTTNTASQRAFAAAGFDDRGTSVIDGHECRVFERTRAMSETHVPAH